MFTNSKDMIGAQKCTNGSRDLDVASLGYSTCYGKPMYQIWSLYLHRFTKTGKVAENGVVCVINQESLKLTENSTIG